MRVVEQQSNPQLGRKAAVLLGEVLQLSSRLLPAESPATLVSNSTARLSSPVAASLT